MNRIQQCFSKLAIVAFAAVLAATWAPGSRAEDQPPDKTPAQPGATAQPAAAAQPTADERLAELEKEVALLQQEIASLKSESTPGIKTAAFVEPAAGAFTPSPAADDAPAKINLAGLLGPITISGFGDAYYGYDYNHPPSNRSGLRFFEAPTNGFSFNIAELILDKAPDATSPDGRLGYHVSAGYGNAAQIVNGSDIAGDGSQFFVKEAYASYLAPIGKGLTVTAGKFVTNAGAEVIESNANWNYSRSMLFYYAIPFFHFGAKAAYTFNPKWAFNVSLVNGWNNSFITHAFGTTQSSGLTYGGTLVYTPSMKWSATENFYAGPVIDASFSGGAQTINDWKQLSDTVIGYTPNAKWAFEVNGDYGFGPKSYTCPDTATGAERPEVFVTGCTGGPKFTWWGIAGYAKYTLSPKTNFATRYEYYEDPNGYTGLLNGTRGHAQEVTGTYSYNLTSGLLVRGEYRYDFASSPFFPKFEKGTLHFVREQNTATVSFVYSFSSANLK
ncbi:MAG TPA: porin [Candidatus Acidoferrales bacterium]|nr:porin [Candidatus Acidoferrales bacterium]